VDRQLLFLRLRARALPDQHEPSRRLHRRLAFIQLEDGYRGQRALESIARFLPGPQIGGR
jgi:hypothetical protein